MVGVRVSRKPPGSNNPSMPGSGHCPSWKSGETHLLYFQVPHPPPHPVVPGRFAVTWASLAVAGTRVFGRGKPWSAAGSFGVLAWYWERLMWNGYVSVSLLLIFLFFSFFPPLLNVFLETWMWYMFSCAVHTEQLKWNRGMENPSKYSNASMHRASKASVLCWVYLLILIVRSL